MNRRGFLKLLGATAAVPVLAQAGPILGATAEQQIVLPADTVVETLETARSMDEATRGHAPPDEWGWRERYRRRVMDQIEADAYREITFVSEVKPFHSYDIEFFAHKIGASYRLSGPLIPERYAAMAVDDISVFAERKITPAQQAGNLRRFPRGLAHVVAEKIGESVERDVLAQLLAIQADAG